jgi:phosphomannomutase
MMLAEIEKNSWQALQLLITHVREGGYDLGLVTDGDADRIALVDEQGEYISVDDTLLLLYWYLHEIRGQRGAVVRNLATTHMLDRLAAHFGETCHEVPVGFKHVAAAMVETNALLGGESSGGLTIRGHILGKDGIFAATLIVEMLARTGQRISQLRRRVYDLIGRLYSAELNLPATSEMRVVIPRRLQKAPPQRLGSYPVVRVSHLDGTKFYLEHDSWALVRFSGTEPVLRLHAEAHTLEMARELIDLLQDCIQLDRPSGKGRAP